MSVNLNMQLTDLVKLCLFPENCSTITNNYETSQIKKYMKYRYRGSVNCTITDNSKTFQNKRPFILNTELQDDIKDN